MLTVQRTFTVDRPTNEVYEYLLDFTNTEAWDPGTVRTTRADEGPLVPGARFRNVSKFRGRETELDYELITADVDKHLVFKGDNKTVTSRDDLTFAAAGTSTSITYKASFDFHGIVALVAPLLKGGIEKLADQTVAQMKQVLESSGAR